MEYNVLYLVKALLKKWYVILLAMGVIIVAAVGLSKVSYKKAVADYQQSMAIVQSENKKVMLATEFSYQLDEAALNLLSDYVQALAPANYSKEELLSAAKASFNAKLADALNDKGVLTEVAEKYELSEEDLSKHLKVVSIASLDKDSFGVYVYEMNEAQANEMKDCYINALQKKLQNVFFSFEIEQKSSQLTVTDEEVQFVNAVMEEPAPPSLVRTVITAALYGFAFACIGVLVYIFVKENKKNNKEAGSEAEKETDCEVQ